MMYEIEIITLVDQDEFLVNPDCDNCHSGGTCQGCEPTLVKVSDTVETFNNYYNRYGSCRHRLVKDPRDSRRDRLEQGPMTTINGEVYAEGRLPGAYELKEYLMNIGSLG